jgi:hypothetical protein
MIRYITWGLFVLITLGAVSFHVSYDDGLYFDYEGWIL